MRAQEPGTWGLGLRAGTWGLGLRVGTQASEAGRNADGHASTVDVKKQYIRVSWRTRMGIPVITSLLMACAFGAFVLEVYMLGC